MASLNEWDRFGAMLRSYSNVPTTAAEGRNALLLMDEEEQARQQAIDKARETKRATGARLLAIGINKGLPQETLQKFAMLAELDPNTIGNLTEDPQKALYRRAEELVKSGKWDPASIKAYAQTGDFSLLKPLEKQGPSVQRVLSPGAQMVDEAGNVIAENKNQRPSAASGTANKPKWQNATILEDDGTPKTVLVDLNNPDDMAMVKSRKGTLSTQTTAGEKTAKTKEVQAASLEDKINYYNDKLKTDPNDINALSESANLALETDRLLGRTSQSNYDKTTARIRKATGGIVAFRQAAETIKAALLKNPDALTAPAKYAGVLNELGNNVGALTNMVSREKNIEIPTELMNPNKYATLRNMAGATQELKTMLLSTALAFATATGLGGEAGSRSMTEADVERGLQAVGANTNDPYVLMSGLDAAYKALLNQHKANLSTLTGRAQINPEPLNPPAQGISDIPPELQQYFR